MVLCQVFLVLSELPKVNLEKKHLQVLDFFDAIIPSSSDCFFNAESGRAFSS